MRKLPARKLLGAAIAGALFLPSTAFTLGLGEIEVNSSLNQTLNADIELLSATPEDTENLIIKLASRKEFSRAGLDRPYSLTNLRFKPEEINGIPYIKVSSGSPIREPYLNFLIEIDWPNGHLLREYTVLLDPPVFMSQPASTASSPANQMATSDNTGFRPSATGSTNIVPVPVPGAGGSSRPSAPAPAQAVSPASASQTNRQSSWVPAPVGKQPTAINQPAGSYRIKAGDTAWSLADAMRPDQSITVSQMMVAMLRANPESFIDENINGLKRGYILRVPDYDQIVAIDQAEARAMVREQAALWRQYQQAQSGGQPVSAMEADASAATNESGAVITGEEDDAYLEIVSAGSGSSTISGKDPTAMSSAELRAELALARERVETEQVEKEALQQRVDTLEQHVEKMKGMLSIEDAELSEVQSLNEIAEGEFASEELVEEIALEEIDAEVMTEAAAESDAAEDVLAEMPEDTLEESVEAGEEALFADEAALEGAEEEAAAEESMADMPEEVDAAADDVAIVQPPMTERTAEPDLITRLLNNPMMLAAAGGIFLLIAGLVGLIIKKRKAASDAAAPLVASLDDDLEAFADDVAATESESLAGEQIPDSEESAESDFDSDATAILDSAEDTVLIEDDTSAELEDDEPRDDVIAEADVYLAYGIYQQAEDLLTQAIADNPERDDYRVKLAETHYASKNAEAFVEVAGEIKKRNDDINSPVWKKVMVMGQDLCADNPMFQGSMVSGLDVDEIAPGAPSMDFDLGMDEQADAPESNLDLSLDDNAIDLPDMDTEDSMSDVEEAAAEPMDELEFDISDTGAIEEPAAAEDEFSLDIDASELDIDIQDAVADAAEEAEDSIDLGDVDLGLDLEDDSSADDVLDVGDIDIDFGLEEETDTAAAEEEEEISLDLSDEVEASLDLSDEIEAMEEDSSLDIDLVEETEAEPVAEVADIGGDVADDEDFDLSSLDDVDEISTKLDLARAYLDMGDHEGTRGILEEVMADGNDEQKQEAGELMAKLD